MSQPPLATVYANGRKFIVNRSNSRSASWFGGPGSDEVIEGLRVGPRRLHHILTLNHGEFGIQSLRFGFKASFYYGLCFEDCELEWQRTATSAIRITSLDPRKSGKEWPLLWLSRHFAVFPGGDHAPGRGCALGFGGRNLQCGLGASLGAGVCDRAIPSGHRIGFDFPGGRRGNRFRIRPTDRKSPGRLPDRLVR